MRFTVAAVTAGVVLGALAGGRPRHVGEHRFRFWPLLGAGLLLQAAGAGLGPATTFALPASFAFLLAFAAANVMVVGMWLVALGIGLNLAVIAVNGGMPVRPAAVVAAGLATPAEAAQLHYDGKRHVERPSDRLLVLADTLPVRPLREVLSFGDLVMAVGAADVVAHLLRPARRRHRRGGQAPPAPSVTAAPAGRG